MWNCCAPRPPSARFWAQAPFPYTPCMHTFFPPHGAGWAIKLWTGPRVPVTLIPNCLSFLLSLLLPSLLIHCPIHCVEGTRCAAPEPFGLLSTFASSASQPCTHVALLHVMPVMRVKIIRCSSKAHARYLCLPTAKSKQYRGQQALLAVQPAQRCPPQRIPCCRAPPLHCGHV